MVTEETTSPDQKLFKKIPLICELVEIVCKSLPQLFSIFREKGEINFTISRQLNGPITSPTPEKQSE